MKKIIIGIVVIVVLAVGSIVLVGRTYFPDNVAETSEDGGTKGLKTRFYDADVPTVRKASKEAVAGMSTWGSGWKIVDETDGAANSAIKIEVPVVVFVDDLEITIADAGEGKSKVDVRSKSRVGKSDFGENKKHIEQFLNALDAKIKN